MADGKTDHPTLQSTNTIMVVLQEDECPIQPGLTAAESALQCFWKCQYYRHQLTVIPDLPAIWPTLAINTVYLAPSLARLGLTYSVPGNVMIYHDPTVQGEYQDEVEEILLWLDEETASRMTFYIGPVGSGVVIRETGGLVVMTVGSDIRVVCNQHLSCHGPVSRILLHPEWKDATRPSLYTERPGHRVYYVQIDSYGLDEDDHQALQCAYPSAQLSPTITLEEHLQTLSEAAAARLLDRWRFCGICEEPVEWCYVCNSCQYPVCSRCSISCRELEKWMLCPHCRIENVQYCALAMQPEPIITPGGVYRAIMEQSPGARVLLLADPSHHTWGSRDVEHRVSQIHGPEEIEPRLLDSDLSATHVISLVPEDYVIGLIRPAGSAPLQVYYLGPSYSSPIRAAAEAGILHSTTVPVETVVYHPTPALVLHQLIKDMPREIRDLYSRLVLDHSCLVHNGRFLDLDLERVVQKAKEYQELSGRSRRRQPKLTVKRAIDQRAWRDGERIVLGISHILYIKEHSLRLRDLWIALDASHRMLIRAPEPEPESDSEEEADSGDEYEPSEDE